MKKIFAFLLLTTMFISCTNDAVNKSDNEKAEATEATEASEAADTTGMIEKAQENLNKAIDTAQSKGEKVIQAAGDTIKKNVIEPVKKDIKKAGEKIKEAVDKVKEEIKQ
jgi:F0F1-type ATP synthase membrane subunit b/b'